MVTEVQITEKVRAIMNEIGGDADPQFALLDEDTIRIDEYIKSCIPDAVALTIQNSKGRCVNPKSSTTATATIAEDGSGSIVLPDDYISLVAFKMEGWRRIVSQAYEMDSEVYRQQSNPVTRAGVCKPVCIHAYNTSGKRVLEFYSVKSLASTTPLMFVYEAKYDSEAKQLPSLNLGDPLFGAVCYMCASLVYSIFENPATAAEMQKIAINLIENGIPHQ